MQYFSCFIFANIVQLLWRVGGNNLARRRKVNIDANPLQSVTIGRTDTKKYGWIGTLFLFIIFIVGLYLLPYI